MVLALMCCKILEKREEREGNLRDFWTPVECFSYNEYMGVL